MTRRLPMNEADLQSRAREERQRAQDERERQARRDVLSDITNMLLGDYDASELDDGILMVTTHIANALLSAEEAWPTEKRLRLLRNIRYGLGRIERRWKKKEASK